jgi:uncharacterized protein (TIGR02271 family)
VEKRSDGFIELEERYAGYEVYDRDGEKIGKVDDLFVDENDQPEYIGVKMDILPRKPRFAGSRATLIPMEVVRVDEEHKRIEVSAEKDHVKEGPAFDDDWEITPPFEESVYQHYGLEPSESATARGAYGSYHEDVGEERRRVEKEPISDAAERGSTGVRGEGFAEERPGTRIDDAEAARSREEYLPEGAGTRERSGDSLREEDELRVQRTEEELRASTREREAGSVRVRKRVRTEREQLRVPKRREEVSVERVSVEGREASEAEIGEEDVRREEVDVDDQTERGRRER